VISSVSVILSSFRFAREEKVIFFAESGLGLYEVVTVDDVGGK
jgi:hypothetical protein